MSRITLGLATMLSFLAFTPVAAQDLMKGYDAFEAGDYATALQEWRPLAEQGDADAQYTLGLFYATGTGVLQDNIIAHMLFNLGATNGHDEARELRIGITKEMTPAAIEKAQAMARECLSSGYTKCGY